MSHLTIYAPIRYLSYDLRRDVCAAVSPEKLGGYSSGLIDALRIRGENDLATRVEEELKEAMAEERRHAAKR